MAGKSCPFKCSLSEHLKICTLYFLYLRNVARGHTVQGLISVNVLLWVFFFMPAKTIFPTFNIMICAWHSSTWFHLIMTDEKTNWQLWAWVLLAYIYLKSFLLMKAYVYIELLTTYAINDRKFMLIWYLTYIVRFP